MLSVNLVHSSEEVASHLPDYGELTLRRLRLHKIHSPQGLDIGSNFTHYRNVILKFHWPSNWYINPWNKLSYEE